MDAISVLRQRSAAKRDEAIAAARATYRKEARLLDGLLESLGEERPKRRARKGGKSVIALVAQVMPQDKPFTIREVMASMEEAEPGREFNIGTLRAEFSTMIDRGMIRRVRRMNGGQLLWAAAGCEVEECPIASLPLSEATQHVLEERGPLNAAEIVVTLQEQNYRPDADPRILLRSVREVFKRNRSQFQRQDGGRWGAADSNQ